MAKTETKPAPTGKPSSTNGTVGETSNLGALAETKGGALSTEVIDYGADAGDSLKNISTDDIAIPFLAILQKGSPMCDPDAPEYNPDAKPGMLVNTVTLEMFPASTEGVLFVPCGYQRKYLRWVSRKAGGGFKGAIPVDEVQKMREQHLLAEVDGKLYVPDDAGNVNPDRSDLVSDTREWYALMLNQRTGAIQQVVISLASTQIKKSKRLVALLDGVLVDRGGAKTKAAMYASMVRFTTVPEKNDKGSWSGANFTLEGMVKDAALYNMAKNFYKFVEAGRATAAYETASTASGAGGGDDDGGPDDARRF